MNSDKAAEGSASLALAWSRNIKPLKAGSLGKVRHKARASGAPKLTLWSPQTPYGRRKRLRRFFRVTEGLDHLIN